MKNTNFDINWINNDDSLIQCCQHCRQLPYIGVDTEFMRTDTFYPVPALLQIMAENTIYLIDPVDIKDFSELKEIIESPAIVKVMHAIGEDVDIFKLAMGATIDPVFDTQIAAGLCSEGVSLGYSKLVKSVLDIDVDKSETRSDWLQRPLTESQIKYAVEDVVHLFPLYEKLVESLKVKNLEDALYEETARLVANSQPLPPQEYYQKLRGGWKLSPRKQHVLKTLCAWRENVARETNVPRTRVLSDVSLVEVANRLPDQVDQLRSIPDIRHRSIKHNGAAIISIVEEALNSEIAENFILINGPLNQEQQKIYKNIKKKVSDTAREAGIPVEMLINKRMLEKTVFDTARHKQLVFAEGLTGWRMPYVKNAIQSELSVG